MLSKVFIQRLVDYQSSGDIFWILYPIRLVGFKMFQVYIYISFSIHTRMMATSWFLATSSMIPGLQGFWWLDTSMVSARCFDLLPWISARRFRCCCGWLASFWQTCHGNENNIVFWYRGWECPRIGWRETIAGNDRKPWRYRCSF